LTPERKSNKDNETKIDKCWGRGRGREREKNGERKNDRHCVRTKVFDGQLWMELEANPPLGQR